MQISLLSQSHPQGDRKWPVEVAAHDRTPPLTHHGPVINNLEPAMSLHQRAANTQSNRDLMTHYMTSVYVSVV